MEPDEWFRQPQRGDVPADVGEGDGPARSELSEQDIERLISRRNKARRLKDFSEADRIRDELAVAGILLEDGLLGTIWKRRP